ncbi:MAG: helix-turn-helix domain-containing protein [Lachnospiraceae bacterium]|nr:helix-turn-helix domain-containing protein [Lachnospiraceae bacterium]
MTRLLKPSEVSECLNIGRDSTYALLKTKGFPSIQIGNQYLVPEDKLEEWINRNIGKKIYL